MSVSAMDLSQLGATEAKSPISAEETGGGEFGQLLQSTLEESASPAGRESEAALEDRGASRSDSAAGENMFPSAEADRGEDQYDESIVDGAGMAAIVLATVNARVEAGGSASPESGRLTDLDFERTNAALADRGRENVVVNQSGTAAAVVGRGRLSAEQAAIVAATVETNPAREGVDPRTTLAVEAGSVGSTRTRLAEGMQDPAEASRGSLQDSESRMQGLSELRDEKQSGSGAGFRREGEDNRGLDRTLFERRDGVDRGADGARLQEVVSALEPTLASVDSTAQAPATVTLEGAGVVANPVAGTVAETTTNTPPGAGGSPAASEAISVQTEWLARHGGGTARILLSPPSLGEVAIQVTLRGGNVDVVMVVNEAAAQSVAENQSDRLAQAFSNHDLRMESFEVRRGNPEDSSNGDLGQFSESESGGQDRAEKRELAERQFGSTSMDGNVYSEVDGIEELDRPGEFSAGPEASVDLRI